LGGIADAQLTSLQAGATRKILHELFTSPRADLDTLEHAIVEAKDIPKHTKDGIVSRFTTMRSIPSIDRMLNAAENKLDIEHELAQGKVICIDADNGFFRDEALTEIYARIFTALILQATQERTDVPEHRLTPTFFYLDEAQDFIARDDKVAKIIYQARKQHLGMVIANHNETQIEAPAVRAALHSSRILSRCIKPGQAEFWLREQHQHIELEVAPVDLIKAPKSQYWETTLAAQKQRYGATVRDEPPVLPDSV
jgi:type IV secretory pathway VirB4 component